MAHHPPPDALLHWPAVHALVGLSRSTIHRMGGDFPRPVRVSPGRVAWRQSEIAAWVESRFSHGGPA